MRIAVVGAGIAGLACADELHAAGHRVILFDKGRRPGGRASSLELDGYSWDFGAQYFAATDQNFARVAARWQREGLVAAWPSVPGAALVGVPTMARVVEAQAAHHAVRFNAHVRQLERSGEGWFLPVDGDRHGPFDAVILALPAEQVAALLSLHDLSMAREVAVARSAPCWTLMVAFEDRLDGVCDVLRDCGDLAWAARNASKPQRGTAECWVIHAAPDWSRQRIEMDAATVASEMLDLFARTICTPLPAHQFAKAHRWRFALPVGQLGYPLWNQRLLLGACGDWCFGATIEDAWIAGHRLAKHVLESISVHDYRTIDA